MDTNVPLIARMTTADAAKNFPGKSRKTALSLPPLELPLVSSN